jgi:hypothetical protein
LCGGRENVRSGSRVHCIAEEEKHPLWFLFDEPAFYGGTSPICKSCGANSTHFYDFSKDEYKPYPQFKDYTGEALAVKFLCVRFMQTAKEYYDRGFFNSREKDIERGNNYFTDFYSQPQHEIEDLRKKRSFFREEKYMKTKLNNSARAIKNLTRFINELSKNGVLNDRSKLL